MVSSTKAFLASSAKTVISYDVETTTEIRNYIQRCTDLGVQWKYIEESTLTCDIDETDLLFIDTLHTYGQLKAELEIHSDKARKYMIFHDTVAYGRTGMDNDTKGLMDALDEFLEGNTEWVLHEHYPNNNGLTVLKRA